MKIEVTPSIEALTPYQAGTPIAQIAKSHGLDADRIVKLASNENPLGAGAKAVEAALQAATNLGRYPDPMSPRLREALARRLAVGEDELVLGNGSNEILELLVRTFCTAEGHAVFGEPAFVVYRLACMAHGVPFTAVPLVNWTHDLSAMADAISDKTQLVFVANPNNPTGTYVSEQQLTAFLNRVPPHVVVVVDEAYIEYAQASDFPDALQLRSLHPGLVVTRTFSKVHGLAALRVGYAVANEKLCNYINRVRAPFNVNSIAQAAAVAALDDEAHVARSAALNARGMQWMTTELTRLGLEVVPSQANFLLVQAGPLGADLYRHLLVHGVIVRPIPPLPHCLRITIGTESENRRCIEALAAVLA